MTEKPVGEGRCSRDLACYYPLLGLFEGSYGPAGGRSGEVVDWRGWGGGLLEGAGPGMFFMLNASGVVARSSRWSVYLFIFSVWVDFCLGYKRGLKRRSFSYSVTVGIIYN